VRRIIIVSSIARARVGATMPFFGDKCAHMGSARPRLE
jgi:hypothetical protein